MGNALRAGSGAEHGDVPARRHPPGRQFQALRDVLAERLIAGGQKIARLSAVLPLLPKVIFTGTPGRCGSGP